MVVCKNWCDRAVTARQGPNKAAMKFTTHWCTEYPTSTNPLKFLWFVSKPYKWQVIGAYIFVTVATVLYSSISYVFKLITNEATAITHGTGSFESLTFVALLYIGAAAASQLAWRMSGFFGAQWASGVRVTGREVLTRYVTLHSRGYFADRFAGSISSKIGHAANGARELVDKVLWQFWEFFVSVVASFVLAYFANPILAAIFLTWMVVAFSYNIYFGHKRLALTIAVQRIETKLNGSTVDLFSNIGSMQDYAHRDYELDSIRTISKERRETHLRSWFTGERMLLANNISQAVFGGTMVIAAVHFASKGLISMGDIILVLSVIYRMSGYVTQLGGQIGNFLDNWGEMKESLEELLIPHEIVDAPNAIPLAVSKAEITLSTVHFSYGGNAVFNSLSLIIPSGQRVGLVGRSGAGKSTLIRLLMRHHDLSGGVIAIDNQNVAVVTQESLRSAIGIVPQESLMFHRTIRDNIAYGKLDATDEEIHRAARMAHASEFIEALPNTYDTMVGERGVKLSGGERQRIAIARAILKNAPILLLDEATSALDSESEIKIQEALHELMQGKTVIAIAHRLSTLREMDRILVLDKGVIVEDGSHNELVAQSGIYADLWSHQAGGFIKDEDANSITRNKLVTAI